MASAVTVEHNGASGKMWVAATAERSSPQHPQRPSILSTPSIPSPSASPAVAFERPAATAYGVSGQRNLGATARAGDPSNFRRILSKILKSPIEKAAK
jgi:hypothetical protein